MKKTIKKILLVLIIVIMFYNIAYCFSNLLKKKISLFGISFFIPESNSMKPEIDQKDVVILKKTKESKLNQDDVIFYKNGQNNRIGKIININENYGKTSYVVKANNRYFNDTEQLLIENINGKMIKKISNGAIFLKILRSKVLTFFIIATLLVRYRLKQYKKTVTRRRKTQKNKIN